MHFSLATHFIFLLTLLSHSLAAPVAAPVPLNEPGTFDQDACVKYVDDTMVSLQSNIKALGNKAASVRRNQIFQLAGLAKDANQLIRQVRNTNQEINKRCGVLDQTHALALAPRFLNLSPVVTETVKILNDNKPKFDRAILNFISVSWVIKGIVGELNKEVRSLTDTVLKMYPPLFQSIVQTVINEIMSALDSAVTRYEPSALFARLW